MAFRIISDGEEEEEDEEKEEDYDEGKMRNC